MTLANEATQETTQVANYLLKVTVQAQLGALDRVLGALTHRGIMPLQFEATLSANQQEQAITATFTHADTHAMTKLAQFLEKQVQVLNVTLQTV